MSGKENLDFMEMFQSFAGVDNKIYYCNKCHSILKKLAIKTTEDLPRKMFYCPNSKCEHFGLVTVVAKKA